MVASRQVLFHELKLLVVCSRQILQAYGDDKEVDYGYLQDMIPPLSLSAGQLLAVYHQTHK
jgi:hypothetical protein